jgi:multisubunit Na+/H+ antiporter MnhB subunit
MVDWIKSRLLERTSFDGAGLIVVGLIVLFFSPLTSWAAYAAIIWGAITFYKKES